MEAAVFDGTGPVISPELAPQLFDKPPEQPPSVA